MMAATSEASTTVRTRLPNLLIVGVAKGGTSSLFSYLAQHDEICASDRKELNYFTRFAPPPGPREYEGPETLEAYAAHFRHCGSQRYVMEATPSYFHGGRDVIEVVRATLRDPRCVVVLRDPIERLWSFYNFERARFGLPKDIALEEYVDKCERLYRESPDGRVAERPYRALAGGFYSDRIEPWLETFGSMFNVVFFDDLARDPVSTVAKLCAWLEIDVSAAKDFNYEVVNKTLQYRNAVVERAARALNVKRRVRGYPAMLRWLRTSYNRLNREDEDSSLDPMVRRRLESIYAEPNRQLATLLVAYGYRDLPPWLRQSTTRST